MVGETRLNQAASQPPLRRRKWNRLDDETRKEVAARYAAGETTTVLATEYGVAKSTVVGILRAQSVVVRRQARSGEQASEAARLYDSGLSLSEVAERMRINQETMRVATIAVGVSLRPATGR